MKKYFPWHKECSHKPPQRQQQKQNILKEKNLKIFPTIINGKDTKIFIWIVVYYATQLTHKQEKKIKGKLKKERKTSESRKCARTFCYYEYITDELLCYKNVLLVDSRRRFVVYVPWLFCNKSNKLNIFSFIFVCRSSCTTAQHSNIVKMNQSLGVFQ